MDDIHPAAGNFRISPHYRANNWRNLKLESPDSPDWAKATSIFHDRLLGRFLAPVKAIESHSDKQIRVFSGFVILAIDCLIIETLYQFYNVTDETDIDHQTAFWHFFRSSPHFKPHFTRKKAYKFYTHFRCGILHQAQTKSDSKVQIDQPEMVKQIDPNDLSKGLVIDRKRFHKALQDEIHDYEQKLRNPQTQQDFNYRKNFKKKMAFIVGLGN